VAAEAERMTDIRTDIRPGTYTIDTTRSAVRFTATHVFGLKPVDGTMTIRSGTVMVAGEPRRSTVSVEIDAASFTTDDKRRNADVRGKRFLDADRFPVIGFRSTRLTRSADGWQIAGVLSVRGGSTEVTLDVTETALTADGYRFTATTTVDRVAAGVAAGRAIIGRFLTVSLTVVVTAG
jgi:polyisoprenoid-binding protein YceI